MRGVPKPLHISGLRKPRFSSIATANLRRPRIPIADTLRNIDQRLATGGLAGGTSVAQTVDKALGNLQQKNQSGAIQSLIKSPQEMTDPLIAAVARHLAAGKDLSAAQAVLQHVSDSHQRQSFDTTPPVGGTAIG